MDFNWSNTPSSVLVKILGFLNHDDLKMASIVCKNWFLASVEPVLLARMVVHIYNKEDRSRFNYSHTKIASGLKLFASSSRDFSRFCLHNLVLDNKNAKLFWDRHVAKITHLTVKNSEISSKVLVTILKMATKLESLEFYDMELGKLNQWRFEDFAGLQGQLALRHLRWREALIISEKVFKLMVGLLKPGTLQSLAIGDFQVDDTAEIIKCQMTHGGFGSGDGLLEIETFADFLRANQTNLRNLEIVDTVQEFAMKALVQTELPHLKLERLALRKFTNMFCPHELTSFFERLQPSLKELLVLGATTDNDTMDAMSAQKNVEVFRLIQKRSQLMDGEAISLLPNFVNLKSLSLHNFDKVSSKDFLFGFSAIKLEALEKLELVAFTNLQASCLMPLLPRLRNLKDLNILNCNTLVNDEGLQAILKDMTCLESLHLTENKKITDAGFLKGPKTIANLDRLQKFGIRRCPKLTDRCLKSIKLPGLKEIFIEVCPLITARGIKGVIDQCPGLQAIRTWQGNVTAIEAVGISEYAKSTLKHMKTTECDVKSEDECMNDMMSQIQASFARFA